MSGLNVTSEPASPKASARHFLGENAPSAVLILIVGLLVVMPIAFMFFGSVREDLIAPDAGFTLDAIRRVYLSTPYLQTLAGTLLMAVGVAALSTAAGGVFAWLLNRSDMPGRNWLEMMMIAPLLLSPFVGAIAWVTLAAPNSGILNVAARQVFGIDRHLVNVMSLGGVIAVMTIYYVPYGYLYVAAALKNMDPSFEEASHINGAGLLGTLRRITLPISWPALSSAFFFIVVLAAGMFSIPAVLTLSGGFVPLAVRIYRSVSSFPIDHATAAAAGTVLFWFTLVGVFLYRRSVALAHRYVTVTARGFRPRRFRLGRWRYLAIGSCVAYALVAVILPYLALLLVTFSPFIQTDLTRVTLTTSNFVAVASAPNVLQALRNTVFVGVVTPTLCVLLALVIAYVVQRERLPGARLLDYLGTLPVAIPGIVFGVGIIWTYIRTPLYATLTLLVVAFVASYLPHALRLTSNGLLQIDRPLEEASRVCGASRLHTLRRVTLPLSKPAVLSAWILVFIFTTREINTAIMIYSPRSRVLSVMTWDFVSDGVIARAAVVGLMQTVLLLAGVVIARFVLRVKLTSGQV